MDGRELHSAEENRRQELYWQGLSDRAIAEAIGTTPSTIRLWRYRRKLPVNKAEGIVRHKNIVLCDTCARATAALCAFMQYKDPDAGLKAVGIQPSGVKITVRSKGKEEKPYKLYRVLRCPRYKRGPLPSITREVVGQ